MKHKKNGKKHLKRKFQIKATRITNQTVNENLMEVSDLISCCGRKINNIHILEPTPPLQSLNTP